MDIVNSSYTEHAESYETKENGTNPFEIIALLFVTPTIFILPSMLSCLNGDSKFRYFKNTFVLNAILLLLVTVFNFLFYVVFILCIYTLGRLLKTAFKKVTGTISWRDTMHRLVFFSDDKIPYLDDLRGHLLHTTAICILAVDFQIFPSKFSKTETYGFSVMDIGVGLFVAIHAVFSPEAKGKAVSLQKSISDSTGLLILGVLRLIAVTAVGYHTAISEYGVHWNFFFTLAFTRIISACLRVYSPIRSSWFIGVALAIGREWFLSAWMTEYILQEERFNLLDKNKEGICSVIGFVIIHLFCIEIGKLMWRCRPSITEYFDLFIILVILWLLGLMLTFVTHIFVQPTSRRMANLAYCIWVISLLCLELAIYLILYLTLLMCETAGKMVVPADTENRPAYVTVNAYFLWKAINSNGLFYFLAANILTGLTNLLIETSKTSTIVSYLVLLTYISVLTEITTKLYTNKIIGEHPQVNRNSHNKYNAS